MQRLILLLALAFVQHLMEHGYRGWSMGFHEVPKDVIGQNKLAQELGKCLEEIVK